MFILPTLPYAFDALEPVVSETTMRTHHGKHHKKYVETLNKLLAEAGEDPRSLEAVIAKAAQEGGKLFNNAGQVWNHGFFWECMTDAPQEPDPTFAALKDEFIKAGADHFGSGWVWICWQNGALAIQTTHDADTLAHRMDAAPLLVCDLWEHAYYLDHKNDRKGFLEQWFDGTANWRFAEAQLRAAQGQGAAYRYPAPTDDKGPRVGKTAEDDGPEASARPS